MPQIISKVKVRLTADSDGSEENQLKVEEEKDMGTLAGASIERSGTLRNVMQS